MFWKKKLSSYKGKNYFYSFRNKLKKEKKITDDFEVMLNTLTIEEIIALKLELSSYNINNKLYNIPIYKNLIYIVKEACLKYALSACRTKGEAARMLGLNESEFSTEVKKFQIEKYFQDEESGNT
tara:strand:+ start:2235 stop:2609 length:375 start_codon:yes stop_codon:yes gene_type:complete